MLKSYLTSLPFTKFVLIEDSLEERGQPIFDYLVQNHLKRPQNIHFFVFHGSFTRAQTRFESKLNTIFYDFTSCGWNSSENSKTFETVASKLSANDVAIVDSLAHAIFQCGLPETYRVFNALKCQHVSQVITLLHTDLLHSDHNVDDIFEHLSTLNLNLQPPFGSGGKRVEYTYKKRGGKVIRQTEEYSFDGKDFVTKKIDRLDPKKLLENSILPQVNPEDLSTFKIGLTEKDKQSREQLVLPYLPKDEKDGEEGGRIFYDLDDADDWDEEDPDDDLDI